MKQLLLFTLALALLGCTPKKPKSLSEYAVEAEARREAQPPMPRHISEPVETVVPVVHITYDTPVEGYDVSIEWYPTDRLLCSKGDTVESDGFGEADITLRSRATGEKIQLTEDISLPAWHYGHSFVDEDSVVLHYVRVPRGQVIPVGTDQLLLFTDVNFDGRRELVVNSYMGGAQGANCYEPYRIAYGQAVPLKYYGNDDWNCWLQDYITAFDPIRKQFIRWLPVTDEDECRVYQFDGTGSAPVLVETRKKKTVQ